MSANRIKQLRLERGLTLTELAKKIGISEGHLSRVEVGARGLKLPKMEALAQALGVPVGDILSSQFVGFLPDVVPYVPPKGSAIERALTSTTQKMFSVLTAVMSELGIREGTPIIADTGAQAVKDIQMGQVVVAEVFPDGSKEGVLLLRQYIAPNLLITNSSEQNLTPIHMLKLKTKIVGRVFV